MSETTRKRHFGDGTLGVCCPGQRHTFTRCKICGESHKGDREYDHHIDFDFTCPTEMPWIGPGPATMKPLFVVCDQLPGPDGATFVELEDAGGRSYGEDVGAAWNQKSEEAGGWALLGPFYTEMQVGALARDRDALLAENKALVDQVAELAVKLGDARAKLMDVAAAVRGEAQE